MGIREGSISSTANKIIPMRYVSIPSAPTLSSPITEYSTGTTFNGVIWYFDIGAASANDGKDVLLAGPWVSGITFNTIRGVKGKPFRFVNTDTFYTSGGATNTHAVQTNNDCTFIEIYGKDAKNPFKTYAGSGQSSFVFNAISGTTGSTLRIQNTIGTNIGYSGLLASTGIATHTYRKLFQNFNRIFGSTADGEGSYNGHNGTPWSRILDTSIIHCAYFNRGREGFQIEHSTRMHVYNTTCYNVGAANVGGQNNLVQVHDSTGVIENCIFDGAPNLMNIFTHNVTFRNCYFRWTNGQPGYIGSSMTSYFSGSSNLNGLVLLFDKCYFHADNGGGTVNYVNQVAETGCNIEYRDCVFSTNITAINQDVRAGSPSNSFIGTISTNGNKKATIVRPTYVSLDIYHPLFGCMLDNLYYNLGMGYRTPAVPDSKLNIIDAVEQSLTKSVAYDTAFSGITGLTTTNIFYLEDGSRVTLPVTWTQGIYNKTGQTKTFTIYGTPASGTTYLNKLGVRAEQDIYVGIAPSPTKNVLINFGPSTGTYIGTGNWNHLFVSNASGLQVVKGDSSLQTLSSLRNTEGTLTGYNVNADQLMSGNNTGQDPSGGGVFPNNAQIDLWYNPGTSGQTRGFFISGLTNGLNYKVEIFASSANYLSGAQTSGYMVSGLTGTTIMNFNTKNNTTNLLTWNNIKPNSGRIYVRVIKQQNQAPINVLRLTYTP